MIELDILVRLSSTRKSWHSGDEAQHGVGFQDSIMPPEFDG